MTRSAAIISLAGSQLDEARRVCAFNSDDEEYRVLLRSIKDTFACDDRAVQVRNPGKRQDYLRRLAASASPSLNELSYDILRSSPTPDSLSNAIAQTEERP